MHAAAGTNPTQHPIDQAGDAELGRDKPFDGRDLADVHADDAGTVCQRSYQPNPPGSGVPNAGTSDASSPSQSKVRYTGPVQAARTSGIQRAARPS